MDFSKRLSECDNFSCVFEIVRSCVEKSLGMKRSSLMLGITDLPLHISAFHAVPSNFIMLNRKLLNAVIQYDKAAANAYVFHVLLHEYLHMLGFLNEEEVSMLAYVISKNYFGEQHTTTLIAKYGISSVFPQLQIDPRENRMIEIVEYFDDENMSYIG